MRATRAATTLLLLLLATACGDESDPEPLIGPGTDEAEKTLVDEAREQIPDAQHLHTIVFKRTCSPDQGVCHNTKEFPDLHTPGNLLDQINKPCNLPEDNENIDDMCEPPGDVLRLDSGPNRGFESRIAHHTVDGDTWIIQLADPLPTCEPHRAAFTITDGDGTSGTIIEAPNQALFAPCTGTEVQLSLAFQQPEFVAGLTNRIKMGDPNQNGVLGFDDGGGQIIPGDPDRSYLLARILGTVPGTRMPLANQPLDDMEHLAFICWIETLDDDPTETDPIRYEDCEAAKEVLETGTLTLPPPMSE